MSPVRMNHVRPTGTPADASLMPPELRTPVIQIHPNAAVNCECMIGHAKSATRSNGNRYCALAFKCTFFNSLISLMAIARVPLYSYKFPYIDGILLGGVMRCCSNSASQEQEQASFQVGSLASSSP